jgi:DNA-binding transcriptional LysR family regulator
MELMQLEMLVAVAEEHSFQRAAERVFRTQPAVSISIRKLERRVGVLLFDRSSRRSGRLTPAGERLYEYACKILGLRDEALSALKRQDSHCEGILRVGLAGEESLHRFPTLWKSFKQGYPELEVKLQLDKPGTVLGELANGELDVALFSRPPRGEVRGENFAVTRVRGAASYGCMWIARKTLGGSPMAHAFEKSILDSFTARATMATPKPIVLRRNQVLR